MIRTIFLLFLLPILLSCTEKVMPGRTKLASSTRNSPTPTLTPSPTPTSTPTSTPTPTSTVLPTPTPTATLTPTAPSDQSSVAHWFPQTFFFNQNIENRSVDSQSATLISALKARGGWGNGNIFQIDYSIDVYYTDAQTVLLPFQDEGVYSPDSDFPSHVPVPAQGSAGFESSQGKTCDGGDCHYIAMDTTNKKLYESFIGSVSGGMFRSSGIVVVWDPLKIYPVNLRGDVCTSADAAGFPIAPLLFSADEVAAGEINHAIRLILPNNRIQYRTYVRPATHGTGASGWATTDGIPYGARFRLKSTYPVGNLSPGAQVVARALQKYGMILADGGQIALTAQSDVGSKAKWSGLLESRDLSVLQPEDFDIVEAGARITFSSFDCVRQP
jgi:hypothetical protein